MSKVNVKSLAERWLRTPYLYGGGGANGIDCSHFVWEILKEAGYHGVPYMTASEIKRSHLYSHVLRDEVTQGDIVYFGGGTPHVGIVVDPEKGTFVGAQSSTGVASASYIQGYWADRTPTFYRYMGR